MFIYDRLESFVNRPSKPTNKLAILLPGYLDNCNYDHLRILSADLAGIGYLVIRFNPTGTWDSAGNINDYCVTQYLRDVADAITWAEDNHKEKFEQIIIAGHSFGGQIALQYGLTQENIDAVVGIMPSFGRFEEDEVLLKWETNGSKPSKRKLPNSDEFVNFDVPFSFLRNREKYPFEKLPDSACQKLIIAGELDEVVDPTIVKKYFRNLSEPKQYELINGIGHDYRMNQLEIAEINRAIIEFLEHLK